MKIAQATILLSLVGLLFFATGCSKEEVAVETIPVVPQPAVAPSRPQAATPIQAAPQAQLSQAQAAMDAREYDRAAESLLALQRSKLSEQQAAAVNAQMQQLQQNLAGAVASGDPKAIAAAKKLRQASSID